MIKIHSNLSDMPTLTVLTKEELIEHLEQGHPMHLFDALHLADKYIAAYYSKHNVVRVSRNTYYIRYGYDISNAPLLDMLTLKTLQLMLGNQ